MTTGTTAPTHSTTSVPSLSEEPSRTADLVTTHTLLNCLIREVSAPEHQVTVVHDHLLLRLPRRGLLLRAALRRVSLTGAHRFRGAVQRLDGDARPRQTGRQGALGLELAQRFLNNARNMSERIHQTPCPDCRGAVK